MRGSERVGVSRRVSSGGEEDGRLVEVVRGGVWEGSEGVSE